ncbi:MAG TPA: phosphoenolpyruvate carboxylase, partial [Pseudomonadales bacterium]|nr:phosphoenolpyruvate carboxylase [Pseudomonadales bacterium]
MNDLISPRLRHRVRTLSTILGETMTRQHGQEFLSKVEEIRLLAKANRQSVADPENSEQGDHEQLRQVLTKLDGESLISVARAFNQFLNLTNIAEQAESTETANGSQLEELFTRLINKGINQQRVLETITSMRCDLVLTAHPTEITRRTLIQ